jgi:hypothetical protein
MAQLGNSIVAGMTIAPSLGTSTPQQQQNSQEPVHSVIKIGQDSMEQPPPVLGPRNPFTEGPA